MTVIVSFYSIRVINLLSGGVSMSEKSRYLGESVVTEAGGMVFIYGSVKMETVFGNGDEKKA